MTKRSPFRYFKTFQEIIRLAVMMYIRFPLSLGNVEDLLHQRSVEISHEAMKRRGSIEFELQTLGHLEKLRLI